MLRTDCTFVHSVYISHINKWIWAPGSYFTLFCSEAILSRIFVLSSVKFSGLKVWLCKNSDKYEVLLDNWTHKKLELHNRCIVNEYWISKIWKTFSSNYGLLLDVLSVIFLKYQWCFFFWEVVFQSTFMKNMEIDAENVFLPIMDYHWTSCVQLKICTSLSLSLSMMLPFLRSGFSEHSYKITLIKVKMQFWLEIIHLFHSHHKPSLILASLTFITRYFTVRLVRYNRQIRWNRWHQKNLLKTSWVSSITSRPSCDAN